MKMFINGRFQYANIMSFDNGWSLSIAGLLCGHCDFHILPTYISEMIEDRSIPEKIAKEYTREKMEARGDLIAHFKGDDGEILDMIVGVASRPTEPHLEKTRHSILQAARA